MGETEMSKDRDHCESCGKKWVDHTGITGTCAKLQSLRLHAVNCREAQRNERKHPSPIATIARERAEQMLDALLKELKP